MKTIEFYGASDDLVEVEGDVPGCDEYPSTDAWFQVAGLNVRVCYGPEVRFASGQRPMGTWAITAFQINEDVPVTATNVVLVAPPDGTEMTEAALRGEAHPPYPRYSLRLRMDVPDGSYVSKLEILP